MKESVLVIIKPDGVNKGLIGPVLSKLAEAKCEIVATKVLKASKHLAEEHYGHLKSKKFFEDVVNYLMAERYRNKQVFAIVFYGEKAVKKCRELAGATNPEEADPLSIRGSFGRITTDGLFENVVHVSSDKKEAEREIKLWFQPDELLRPIYPTATRTLEKTKVKVWQ